MAQKGREGLFRVGLILIPLVVLLAIEGALRLTGAVEEHPLFIPAERNGSFLTPNSAVAYRYFSKTDNPPTIQPDYFRAEKTDSTFRVVVQGGSTAAGFPFYYGGTFPRILENRLQASMPNQDVEVINVSMAAINSFALWDMSREIVEIHPDAILLYAGHNEYYGALGIGSRQRIPGGDQLVRLYLRLQRLRLVQLLKNLLETISAGAQPSESRMAQLAKERSIALGSATFRHGIEQVKANLGGLIRRYVKKGIPVYISTVASNLRDQEPFVSFQGPDSVSASAQFARGKRLLQAGRLGDAGKSFTLAKDLDGLRFRAPEDINSTIRELAASNDVQLVDAAQQLEDSARFGIIGDDLMVDHLHPTSEGYALIADAFYRHLHRDGLAGEFVAYDDASSFLTPVDSLVGMLHVSDLRTRWPFSDSTAAPAASDSIDAFVVRLAKDLYAGRTTWVEANSRLITHYERSGNPRLALRAAESRRQELPHLFGSYVPAARLLARQDRFSDAAVVLLEALEADEMPEGHLMLADVYRAMKNGVAARRHRTRALELSATK